MKTLQLLIISLTIYSCQPAEKEQAKAPVAERIVHIDSTFNSYFLPKGDGYTGGDGAYSVLLPDGRNVWIWGDTFMGNVTDSMTRIKTNPLYIRNSFTIIKDDKTLQTIHQGERSEWKSMMIPPEVADGSSGKNELELWYWPGDAFIENNSLKIFLSKFSQENKDMWGFEFQETELFEFSLPDFEIVKTRIYPNQDGAHFGHAVCQSGKYTYIYGLKGQYPHVARAPKDSIGNSWEYFDGKAWSTNVKEAAPMIEFSGSEQFSVFQHQEKFILITQEGGFGTGIFSFIADSPAGPWVNKQKLYDTPKDPSVEKLFTYNAMAHPQFIKDDMLLISYNTNSMELQDHYNDALIYRPRFIRVPMEMILKQ